MTIYYPEETPALGTTKIAVTDAILSPTAPKLATEINAATSFEATLTFHTWDPQVTVNSGNTPPRVGTKNQFPQEGLASYQPIEVTYPYDPQADDTDPNNDAKASMVQGTIKAVVVRKGPDAEDEPFAVGDRTETWSVRAGRQTRATLGEGEFAVHVIRQMLYPIKEEGYGVVVA